MMRINGFNGTNMQAGTMGLPQANDAVSKSIQNQIANAQQRLRDLSSDEELSLEDKMKKRQEIQQEIASLNQQLRQHQIEQQKEQQRKSAASMDDMIAGTKHTSGQNGAGLSQAGAILQRRRKSWQICRQRHSLQQRHRCLPLRMQINP